MNFFGRCSKQFVTVLQVSNGQTTGNSANQKKFQHTFFFLFFCSREKMVNIVFFVVSDTTKSELRYHNLRRGSKKQNVESNKKMTIDVYTAKNYTRDDLFLLNENARTKKNKTFLFLCFLFKTWDTTGTFYYHNFCLSTLNGSRNERKKKQKKHLTQD